MKYIVKLLLLWVASLPLWGACTTTTVADTVLNAAGSPLTTTALISWGNFTTANGDPVVADSIETTITSGALSVALCPTTGTSPAIRYRVRYRKTPGGQLSPIEYWSVPAGGGTVALNVVRSVNIPNPTFTVPPSFIGRGGAVNNDVLFYSTTTHAWTVGAVPPSSTATALAANGSNCSAGQAPRGVDASGAAENCTGYLIPSNNLSDLTSASTARTSLGLGSLAVLSSLSSGDIPNNAANTSGNAATATALAANGTNCSSGDAPRGVDASGNAENCFTPSGGGATIPSVTNLIEGNGSGNGADSGIAAANVVQLTTTQTVTNKTVNGVTPTVFGYLDPTSSVQTQLNGKAAVANNLSDLTNSTTARTNLGLGTAAVMAGPSGTIVGTTDTQTLTNKTVDGVTPTTFGYLDATSSIQTQLNAKASSSAATTVNGITCTLGSTCTVTASLPSNPTNCSAGQAPLGVDASGNVEGCFTPSGGGGGATIASTTNVLIGDGAGNGVSGGVAISALATLTGTETLTNKTLTLGKLTTFTSGGVVYTNSSGQMVTSAALDNEVVVTGGGSGNAVKVPNTNAKIAPNEPQFVVVQSGSLDIGFAIQTVGGKGGMFWQAADKIAFLAPGGNKALYISSSGTETVAVGRVNSSGSGTLSVYDANGSGVTTINVRAGASQSTTETMVVYANNGSTKDFSIRGNSIFMRPVAVSALPSSPVDGQFAYVNDLTTPVYGSTATGGGSVKGLVHYDGSNWIVG